MELDERLNSRSVSRETFFYCAELIDVTKFENGLFLVELAYVFSSVKRAFIFREYGVIPEYLNPHMIRSINV